jgi:hypothetical protein
MKINFLSLNKSQNKKILLLHGLFTSSGYWMPYIGYLKNYHLIIPHINYNELLANLDKNLSTLNDQISNFSYIDNVISHSFGCVLSDTLTVDSNFINICPVQESPIINRVNFIYEIAKISKQDREPIEKTINESAQLYSKIKNTNSNKKIIQMFPNDDIYFHYKTNNIGNKYIFEGDHFEIKNAFKEICKKKYLH